MADQLLFLTELLGLKVFDLKGRRIGVVKDAALVPLVDPVRVDRYLVGTGTTWWTVRFDQIRSLSLSGGIYLSDENVTPYHSDEYMLRMVRDLLDQQIIDAQGRKVVRINDVTFEVREENGRPILWVLEVDIGIRSMFRRVVQGLPPGWVRRLQSPIPPHSIRWEFCNILEPDPQRRLRLNISNRLLEDMHPADLADIVEELSPKDREAIFENIDSEVAADALSEVEPGIQASILESLEAEKAADIVEEMAPDQAANALSEMQEENAEDILDEMETAPKAEVEELMVFDPDTAGGMMNNEFVALPEEATVADAISALKANDELLENLHTLFLIDPQERLKAAVPLARLFLQEGATPLRSLAVDRLISVSVDEQQDRVTETFDKYNLLTLPVLEGERLAGVITADDIISVLRQKE
jgi:magnesium transporter